MIYLVVYALIICGIVLVREWGEGSTLERFLVADRRVGGFVGSMSIAASWIWAPAIFVSSQTGYKWGLSGLAWFVFPNMLALIIFAPLAERVRKSIPEGYSYIEYIKLGHPSFVSAQLWIQLSMQVVIFAIQLVAGAELLSQLTGARYEIMVVGMALTPICYTSFSGLRTSVFTDAIQYALIALSTLSIWFFFPHSSDIVSPMSFKPFDTRMLLEFGLSSALGLIVAIFADHQQWQRTFAVKRGQVARTFYVAALLHGLVTISLGSFGIRIFSSGFIPQRLDLVGFEFISGFYPEIFVPIFVVMAMCALISTLDSALCAFSSLTAKELLAGRTSIRTGRASMAALVLSGAAIALIRPSLLTLWFFASTIRLAAFAPTLGSLLSGAPPSKTFTIAEISGLLSGGIIFGLGLFLDSGSVRTLGMILSLVVPTLVLSGTLAAKRFRRLQPAQFCALMGSDIF